jgi:hypothetical protein
VDNVFGNGNDRAASGFSTISSLVASGGIDTNTKIETHVFGIIKGPGRLTPATSTQLIAL